MTNSFEQKSFPVKELPSGDSLNLTIYRIRGNKPGPHVHIQSSVHGAELQGNLVIMELMRYLAKNPINGSINLIPMANPQATNTKFGTSTQGRFNPITGDNWNRNYTDISHDIDYDQFLDEHIELDWKELRRAFKNEIFEKCNSKLNRNEDHYHVGENKKNNLILQKIASTADIILDLHTGPVACRYLYSAEYQKDVAKELLSPYTLIIPNEFAGAMDEACFTPWVKLHKHLDDRGISQKPGVFSFTVELGSEEKVSSEQAKTDCERIIHFLQTQNVLEAKQETQIKPGKWSELSHYQSYNSPVGGLFESLVLPGTEFNEGDLLAKIHKPRNIESLDSVDENVIEIKARHSGVLINHTPTASVCEGMEIIQILTDLKNW